MRQLQDYLETEEKKLFLVDASGVLYNDLGPFPGVVDAVNTIRERGHSFVVATNNTTSSIPMIAEKLQGYGMSIGEDHILSSGLGLSLLPEYRCLIEDKKCYVVGPESSDSYVVGAGGVVCSNLDDAELVIFLSSFQNNNDVWLEELVAFAKAHPDIPYICANPDHYVQHSYGRYEVIGYYVKQFEERTGIRVMWLGKPYPNFSELIRYFLATKDVSLVQGAYFFDDNPKNVAQVVHDLSITGVCVCGTGLDMAFCDGNYDKITSFSFLE